MQEKRSKYLTDDYYILINFFFCIKIKTIIANKVAEIINKIFFNPIAGFEEVESIENRAPIEAVRFRMSSSLDLSAEDGDSKLISAAPLFMAWKLILAIRPSFTPGFGAEA